VQALAVYDGSCTPGKKVVMIGGGLVGTEEALFLAKTGHEVTVVEMLPRIATESFGMYREALLLELEKEHVTLLTDTKCLGIEPGAVRVQAADGTERTLEADTVLYALGMKATNPLQDAFDDCALTVVSVGDATRPRQVEQAVYEAVFAVTDLG